MNEIRVDKADLHLFQTISNSIQAADSFEEMVGAILHRIKDALQADGASIALHEPEAREFFFIRTVETQKYGRHDQLEKMRFPDDRGIAAWVLRNNQTATINDTASDERVLQLTGAQNGYVVRSMICVPLKTLQGPIGVLYAVNKLIGEFTQKDALLMEILSVTVAMAVENNRLYQKLQSYAWDLETENKRLRTEIQEKYEHHGIVGASPAMRRLYNFIEKVTDTETAVLIEGETGTGKELVARVIHYGGPRRAMPFVAENCGALTDTLLESELFGHVKGAFTGAAADKKGLFELADGGTILLDEIGEMPPNLQVKMLRVLQEGEFRPVGGSRTRKVDVRVIACTNRNLEDEVQKNRFRKDLYFRISVFPLHVPPLRERKEDLPMLANHFLELFSKKAGRAKPGMTPAALDLLMAYDWPGNVRELQNELERAMALAKAGEDIGEVHLSAKMKKNAVFWNYGSQIEGSLPQTVAAVEQRMIRAALESTDLNRSRAARLLGITRQGLLKKIKRYEMDV